MLVTLAYCPKDLEQTTRLAHWINELGGAKGHSLLLVVDTHVEAAPAAEIEAQFRRAFGSVEVLPFVDHYKTWPQAPNACFATVAKHIEFGANPQPWLWLEPDCVPLHGDWLDTLWAEYMEAKKPFLGDFVSVHTPEIDVEDHMSGVAIYPAYMTKHGGLALIAGDGDAWDVTAAVQIVPLMHRSKHIMHAWKHGPFEDWAAVEREIFGFKPECVLFHADKAGSLYSLLREKFFPEVAVDIDASYVTEDLTREQEKAPEDVERASPPDSQVAMIRDSVAILKRLCNSSGYLGVVRRELRRQGVIK